MKDKTINYQLIFRRASFVIYDVASVLAASFLAISMRYEFEYDMIPEYFLETIIRFLPFNIVFTIIICDIRISVWIQNQPLRKRRLR